MRVCARFGVCSRLRTFACAACVVCMLVCVRARPCVSCALVHVFRVHVFRVHVCACACANSSPSQIYSADVVELCRALENLLRVVHVGSHDKLKICELVV